MVRLRDGTVRWWEASCEIHYPFVHFARREYVSFYSPPTLQTLNSSETLSVR